MNKVPRGLYTPEFRQEAVKLVETSGQSIAVVAQQLSVPKGSLGGWVRAAREGKLGVIGQGQRIPTETEVELARLRKELATVKQERDLLKKFAAYFAKESQ